MHCVSHFAAVAVKFGWLDFTFLFSHFTGSDVLVQYVYEFMHSHLNQPFLLKQLSTLNSGCSFSKISVVFWGECRAMTFRSKV